MDRYKYLLRDPFVLLWLAIFGASVWGGGIYALAHFFGG